MLHSALFLAALVAQTPAPATVITLPRVELGVRTYRSDGRSSGYAGASPDEDGFVAVSGDLCRVGASRTDDFFSSWSNAVVWRLKTRTVEQGSDTWIIDVEWQRIRDRGQPTPSSPTGTRRLTVRAGERLQLDSVLPLNLAGCDIAEAKLEAGVGMWPAQVAGARAGGGTGSGGVGMSGGSFGGGGGGGAMIARPVGPPLAIAELWLVHTRPDGTDEGRRVPVSVTAGTNVYEFPVLPIDGPYGKVNVQVRGFVRPTVTKGEITSLTLMIDRRIRSDEDARVNSAGAAVKEIPLPKPLDVVAIEMPPVAKGERDALLGHLFSLRLRLSPAK